MWVVRSFKTFGTDLKKLRNDLSSQAAITFTTMFVSCYTYRI